MILIPETLFDCIKNSHEMDCFIPFNKYSIGRNRTNKSRTPEWKQAFSAKMSVVMKKVRKKYIENITPAQKKAFAERMRKGQKRYWANVSEEDRKKHIETMSKGMTKAIKKAWADGVFGTKKEHVARLHGVIDVENDLPRINTYSGVITYSEMESL